MTLVWRFGAHSDIGRTRKKNDDAGYAGPQSVVHRDRAAGGQRHRRAGQPVGGRPYADPDDHSVGRDALPVGEVNGGGAHGHHPHAGA